MKKYESATIATIWSDETTRKLAWGYWSVILNWLEDLGFKDARRKDMKIAALMPRSASSHEVIDLLRDFVRETGLVNAHAGLTSSDIIDNVRLAQCEFSRQEVLHKLHLLGTSMLLKEMERPGTVKCLGYTHWQPASPTTTDRRVGAWNVPLLTARDAAPPQTRAKRIAGATGTGRAIEILTSRKFLPGSKEQPLLAPLDLAQEIGIQSSYFDQELRLAQWLELIAAQIHKIMQDIRFLCSTGELRILKDKNYRGSSAMPGKNNPIEAEQLCGLARLQPSFTRQMWDAMAFNGLERTLDNSSMVRVTLPAMFHNAVYLLEGAIKVFDHLEVNEERCRELLRTHFEAANREERLANEIKKGKSRAEAYEEMIN